MGYEFLKDPAYLAFEEQHAKKLQALEVRRAKFLEQYRAEWNAIIIAYHEGYKRFKAESD